MTSSMELRLKHERERAELYKLKLEKLEALETEVARKASLPHLYLHNRYQFQVEFENEIEHRIQILCAANQLSKMQLNQQLIPTPSGFMRVDSIAVGDEIFGDDGKPCRVTDIPFIGEDECYEVTFGDGTSLTVSKDHMWRCKGERQRFARHSRGKKNYASDYGQWVERSTLEMYERGFYARSNKPLNRFVVPYTEPVEYPHKDGLLDCYALGLILGDGTSCSSTGITLSKNDKEVLRYLMKMFGGKYTKKGEYDDGKGLGIRFQVPCFPRELVKKRSWEKFIPVEYLTASVPQRLALLRGLMDTDGTVNSDGDSTSFTSTSEQLAGDVRELVFSLGGTSKIKRRQAFYKKDGVRHVCRDAYTVAIKMPPTINPFLLKRKAKRWRGEIRYAHERTVYSIQPVGVKAGRCFTVDSPNACFLAGKNYVVSHNSSSAIQRLIDIATDKSKWEKYWPDTIKAGQVPAQWWYLYPSMEVATVEFEEKWKPLLPTNKNDPQYGWEIHLGKGGYVRMLAFNSGINLYFKSYEQSAKNLQSGSVYLLVGDEEMPVHLVPELQFRVNATKGYMWFVLTATLGQNFWKEVIEDRKRWKKEARIWQLSLYDCQKYADGTPSKWTTKAIEETIAKCITEAEVQRRVFGRFVRDEGLMFESFSRDRHLVPYTSVPIDWMVYAGVDYGSGGVKGHPSAIVFVAVNPQKTHAKVIRTWRGDSRVTTCKDVVDEFKLMASQVPRVDYAYYDFAAKDLATFAQAIGLSFIRADKDRTDGIGLINTLFKTNRLEIMYHGTDLQYTEQIIDDHMAGFKLADELGGLGHDTSKKVARDDCCVEENQRVATVDGWVPIKDLVLGQLVWTRQGLKPVIRIIDKGMAEVVSYHGAALTPDHKVWSKSVTGWVENQCCEDPFLLEDLCKKMSMSLFSTRLPTEGIPAAPTKRTPDTFFVAGTIGKSEEARSIATSGLRLLVQCQKAIIFTIKTAIILIMILLTFSAYSVVSILVSICRSASKTQNTWRWLVRIWQKPSLPPPNGTQVKTGTSGTRSTLRRLLVKMFVSKLMPFASFVQKLFVWITSALRPMDLNFAATSVSLPRGERLGLTMWSVLALSAARLSLLIGTLLPKNVEEFVGPRHVYDIEVQDCHEFFAEGILCHNCDALRYAIMGIGFDWEMIGQHGANISADAALITSKNQILSIDEQRKYGEQIWLESQNDAFSAEEELAFWNNQMDHG